MHITKINLMLLSIIGLITTSSAQAEPQTEFYDNLLLSEEYSQNSIEQELANDARQKLQDRKNKINIKDNRKLQEIIKRQQKEKQSQTKSQQDIARISKLKPAPFGLLWGETYQDTINSGVSLTKTEEKDYVNSFIATQLPKPIKDMRYVVITFGEENKLWRIISYGDFINDTPNASKILKEYRRYYNMLNKKYGNAEQVFTPKISQITKTIDIGQGKTKQETENVENPIGNDNFLAELQSGEADLYATFYNKEVGVALSVNVDGAGNSYLILEYKNLKIFQAQQDQTLEAL